MKKLLIVVAILLGVLIVIPAIAGLFSRDRIEIPASFKGSYIEVHGEKIRCLQAGNGPDLLLIHGLPGSIEDWESVMGPLSARYRITAYDRPGHGFSGAEKTRYTIRDNARFARGVIEKMGLKNVIAVGHSYGGGIVLALAALDPEGIRGVISIAGVSRPLGQVDPFFYVNIIPVLGRGLAAIGAALLAGDMVEEGVKDAFKPNETLITKQYMETRKIIFTQTKVIVTTSHEDVGCDPDLAELGNSYGKIAIPVRIIHGEADAIVPFKDSAWLEKEVKTAKLVPVKNTGHMVQYAHPETIIAAVEELNR